MKGLLLSATIEGVTSRKDHTVKLTIGTQELSQGKAGEVFSLMNKLACIYICEKEIDSKEIDQVDKIDPELQGKTQSQRIRNVLFLLFKQGNEGFKDFDSYYKSKTEMYIEHLKSKLL